MTPTEFLTPLCFLQLLEKINFCLVPRSDTRPVQLETAENVGETAVSSLTGKEIRVHRKRKNDCWKKLEKAKWGQKSPNVDAASARWGVTLSAPPLLL